MQGHRRETGAVVARSNARRTMEDAPRKTVRLEVRGKEVKGHAIYNRLYEVYININNTKEETPS